MMAFCPEYSKWDQNPKFTPLSETTSIPTPSICRAPPPGACDVFHCVLVSPCLVSGFLALLHNHCYSLHKTKSGLVISIWLQGPGPVATKMLFFHRNSNHCEFFQLQPKRETSFSSLGDNEAFCAKRKEGGGENSTPNIVGSCHLRPCW